MKRYFIWLLGLVFLFGFGWPVLTSANSHDYNTLSGYAWSSNIGWVRFFNNDQDWNVVINKSSKFFEGRDGGKGYAWSNNIGWIKFDPDFTGPEDCSSYEWCHGLKIGNPSGDQFYALGWARACSVAANCDFANLKSDPERGGWDGWIWFDDDYNSGSGGGVGWYNDRGDHDDNWGVFECNDGLENDEEPDGIDTADPECHSDGDIRNGASYIFYWNEDVEDIGFDWFKNLINRALAQNGYEYLAGFGWGSDVIGWLFVDLEIDGELDPTVNLTANNDDSDSLTIGQDDQVTLAWTSSNASSCLADSDDDRWEGNKTPNEEGSLDLPPPDGGWSLGSHFFELTCKNAAGAEAVDRVDVTVQSDNITVELSASGGGPEEKDDLYTDTEHDVTLRWETTNNPDKCTASESWGGQSKSDEGSELLGSLGAGDYQYSLTCTKTGQNDLTNFVNVHVEEPGDDSCESGGLEVVGDGVIEIDRQSSGHEVLSSLERIKNTCTEAITVSVKDVLSMTYDRGQGGSGSLIRVGGLKHPQDNDQLTGIHDSNQQLPKCVLSIGDDRTRRDCAGASISIPLYVEGNNNTVATFGIEIWRPIKTIKDYTHYRVKLGDPATEDAWRNAEITFEYLVEDVIDE